MITARFILEKYHSIGRTPKGDTYHVFTNPSHKELREIVTNVEDRDLQRVRFIADNCTKTVYAWEAAFLNHNDARKTLNLRCDRTSTIYINSPWVCGHMLDGIAEQEGSKFVLTQADTLDGMASSADYRVAIISQDWSWADRYIVMTPYLESVKKRHFAKDMEKLKAMFGTSEYQSYIDKLDPAYRDQIDLLLESLYVVKSRREGDPISISENPSSIAEVLRDLKDETRTLRFKQDSTLRFFLDLLSGDLLVWNANLAIHDDVLDEFNSTGIAGLFYLDSNEAYLYMKGISVPVRKFQQLDIEKSFDRLVRLLKNFKIRTGAEYLSAALHRYVRRGDLVRTKEIIELLQNTQAPDAFINYEDPEGKTPLYHALKVGDHDIIDYLKSVGGITERY
jgi:hypothetical protein